MKDLFADGEIRRCAESGEGYRFGDLMLYPITVRDYVLFHACSSSLMLRQSMLPVKYAIRPYADALFAMAFDEELRESKSEYSACFAMFIRLLAKTLRVNPELFQYNVDMQDQTVLRAIIVKQESDELGEELIRLEPGQLGQIRRIIAILNGKDLPDEADNAELIEAENIIRSSGVTDLKADITDLKASVAAYYHVRLRELEGWTIYEFEKARSAIERLTRCVICGIGEAGGMVKWEKGNPFPSLFFDRKPDNPALINMDDFQRRIGGAVASIDQMPEMPV